MWEQGSKPGVKQCECANAGELGLSVKQVFPDAISSNLIIHTKEKDRPGRGRCPETVGCKGRGGKPIFLRIV